jgi:peptidoglycan/xylan/chitin deacetylase (PgdA/CDA1 family)
MKHKIIVFVLSLASLLLLGGAALWPLPEKVAQGEAAKKLPVLVYHAVYMHSFSEGTMTSISYSRFTDEMRYLYQQGYKTLSMEEAVRFMRGEKFPPKVVVIAFDDGLVSSLYAVPVLWRYGFKATFFVIPGFAQPHPERPGADNLYMSWRTLSRLDRIPGIEIESHTLTHPWREGGRLTDWMRTRAARKQKAKNARLELVESKRLLEEHLGREVSYLSWPVGAFSKRLVNMARNVGYEATGTTMDGFNRPGGDPMRLHRIMVNGACDLESFEKIMSSGRYQAC